MIQFALDARLDVERMALEFAATGVLSIAPILEPDCAATLHNHLRERQDWSQCIGNRDRIVELGREARAALVPEQKEQLDLAVYAGARQGFQFRYETIRVPDEDAARAASDDVLAAFARWWSSAEPRDVLRRVITTPEIDFADLQATAYSPGDFLTGHTDDVDGKGRVAAYVLNLTPKWQVEWGGLLAFHDDFNRRVTALVPDFNRLNLFRVPQLHSVTEVTRIAPYRRYSLTGWLRQGEP